MSDSRDNSNIQAYLLSVDERLRHYRRLIGSCLEGLESKYSPSGREYTAVEPVLIRPARASSKIPSPTASDTAANPLIKVEEFFEAIPDSINLKDWCDLSESIKVNESTPVNDFEAELNDLLTQVQSL
jgi:hypothetical protein